MALEESLLAERNPYWTRVICTSPDKGAREGEKSLRNTNINGAHRDALHFLVMGPSLLQRLAVGIGWWFVIGGWWRLAVGGWRSAVSGPSGPLKDPLSPGSLTYLEEPSLA